MHSSRVRLVSGQAQQIRSFGCVAEFVCAAWGAIDGAVVDELILSTLNPCEIIASCSIHRTNKRFWEGVLPVIIFVSDHGRSLFYWF
jgi:hypothetical protein